MKQGKLWVGLLALSLSLAMAGTALAAQVKDPAAVKDGVSSDYLSTPKNLTSAYPDGIYLPDKDNPAAARIHSNYTKKTDACASCHATHTGVGQSLLQWNSVYNTCMACHDGTVTTTYDVQNGKIGSTNKATFGGMFGAGTTGSASNHEVTGAVDILAAPGGDKIADSFNGVDGKKASWEVEFGCQSCHSPHGAGGNTRILNPDPNGWAWAKYNAGLTKNVAMTKIGDKTYKTAVIDKNGDTWLKGYPYSKVTVVSVVYGNPLPASDYTIDNSGDYTKVIFKNAPAATPRATFVPALRVKMDISSYLQAAETVSYKKGVNTFCGACHTDYNTESALAKGAGSTLNGTYSEAYRHAVGFDYKWAETKLNANSMKLEDGKVNCMTCHVAHGTNQDYWAVVMAGGRDWSADRSSYDWGGETNGSSALKRLPNMGTCETCHQKGDGNQGYVAATDSTVTKAGDLSTATFVGSTACQSCHDSQYTGWNNTSHSKMIRNSTNGDKVLANAKDPIDQSKFNFTVDYSAIATKVDLATGKIKANQTGVFYGPADVVKVIGYKWKQRYLVNSPDGGYQFLAAQWNVKEQKWDAYGSTQDWDQYCITCHSVGYKINSITYDTGDLATANQVTSINHTWKEDSIGCEACHGPGSTHVAGPSATNIYNPSRVSAIESSKVCGYCHTRGESDLYKTNKSATVSWREDYPAPVGETFIPGTNMDYEDWGKIPGVTAGEALGDYNGVDGAKKADPALGGMVFGADNAGFYAEAKHHQEYQGFLQSRHYKSAAMSCATCHSGHSRNAQGEQLKLDNSQVCSSCHGAGSYNVADIMPMTGKTIQNIRLRTHTFTTDGARYGDGSSTNANSPYKTGNKATLEPDNLPSPLNP